MAEPVRERFIGWQCRIRQLSVREHEGRPLGAMRPRATLDGRVVADAVTVLIHHRDPGPATALFRHMVMRTHDPKLRREAALRMLASQHYQDPGAFGDTLTALFPPGSENAARFADACILHFAEFAERYDIPCRVAALDRDDPLWRATFWHNHLFNPSLPDDALVLAFAPQWPRARHRAGAA